MREAFPVETQVANGYGGMQLAIVFNLEWGNQQRRMYSLSLNMHQPARRSRDDFIRFPTTHIEIQTTINNFEMKYDIPQIVGVVDGSQVTCARW